MSEQSRSSLQRVVSHGAELVAESWGTPDDPAVVLLHGGGQTRHAWRRAGERLAQLGFYALIPDLRGHGESAWSPDGRYSPELYGDDVRAWCTSVGKPVALVGASLGGLSSLIAAGEAPRAQPRALVLVDIAHRGEPPGISRILNFMRAYPDGFDSFEHALSIVAQYLPHRAASAGAGEGLRRNLREREDGRLVWHWDPRLLQGTESTPTTRAQYAQRMLAAARHVNAPILVVRGADSDVLSPEIADEFCREVPRAQRADVAGARHMVAGDQNDPFLEVIVEFLKQPEVAQAAPVSAQ
jgi:pimeloyl-ACP methyl ester carboxylesterase